MTEHAPTQCDRMLERLARSPGDWVPMPELARVMSDGGEGTGICVSRRIYDLRKRGNLIEVRAEQEGKQKHLRRQEEYGDNWVFGVKGQF